MRVGLIGCLLLLGWPLVAVASPLQAPVVVGDVTPVVAPYDLTAKAPAQVDAAFAAARASGRAVLLDFGANWCPDCRVLAGVMENASVKPWIDQHFETVRIDVGRFDKNMDIARRYGVTVKGIPALLVVRPDGTLLDPDGTRALSNARSMSPQAMVDLLADWDGRPAPR